MWLHKLLLALLELAPLTLNMPRASCCSAAVAAAVAAGGCKVHDAPVVLLVPAAVTRRARHLHPCPPARIRMLELRLVSDCSYDLSVRCVPFTSALECVTAAAAVNWCSRAFSGVVLSGSALNVTKLALNL